MFSYNTCTIVSAAPLTDIKAYLLCELGGVEKPGLHYECGGLEIALTPCTDAFPSTLFIPRHRIHVRGDRVLAEQFLTAFRFRFLSAGG